MIHVEQSAVIDARAEAVYDVIRDYEVGHPAILPKQYFKELTVLEGGKGEGTKVRVVMNVMGNTSTFTPVITEPQPGRLLVEADNDIGLTTRFIFEPLEGGAKTRVTFATAMQEPSGVVGFIQRLMTPPLLRRVYKEELGNLAAYVSRH